MTYDVLFSILSSGSISCLGSRKMCVLGYVFIAVARLYFNVVRCSVLAGSRWRECCSINSNRVKDAVLVDRKSVWLYRYYAEKLECSRE